MCGTGFIGCGFGIGRGAGLGIGLGGGGGGGFGWRDWRFIDEAFGVKAEGVVECGLACGVDLICLTVMDLVGGHQPMPAL
jgi:hypothetical protein